MLNNHYRRNYGTYFGLMAILLLTTNALNAQTKTKLKKAHNQADIFRSSVFLQNRDMKCI